MGLGRVMGGLSGIMGGLSGVMDGLSYLCRWLATILCISLTMVLQKADHSLRHELTQDATLHDV